VREWRDLRVHILRKSVPGPALASEIHDPDTVSVPRRGSPLSVLARGATSRLMQKTSRGVHLLVVMLEDPQLWVPLIVLGVGLLVLHWVR
jgi:hypothetical protein